MYDFSKPTGFSEETGHFTQLVWKGTREVGCAAVDCGLTDPDGEKGEDGDVGWKRAQGWYVVCEYGPAGNVVGSDDSLKYFRMNVQEGSGSFDPGNGDVVSIPTGGGGGLLGLRIRGIGWWIGMVVYIFSSV